VENPQGINPIILWIGLILLGHWLMVSEWLYVGDSVFVLAMHGI
jgi:hypothetical protein